MRNQPKYNFFKNTSYALSGIKELFKSESSFRIEFVIFIFCMILLYFLPFKPSLKLLLFCSFFMILIAESINSAIERVVDLVTGEFHPLAKSAKDIASGVVFLSICQCVFVWLGVFYMELA